MLKTLINKKLFGWYLFELCWLIIASIGITALSVYWHDTWYGIVSALSGVICVILTGKGKLAAYAFGILNCCLYGYISYNQALYGETMLNILYYLPMQFYGFFIWRKNMNSITTEVIRKKMHWFDRIDMAVYIAVCTVIYGLILILLNDPLPFIDSFTTVASVFAMFLSCKRYVEQWYLWLAVDIMSVYMWWNRYCIGGDNIATLLMWIVFLLNAVYGCIKWELDARRNTND